MSAVVVLCCGAGGVGKTTVSAALALRWAAAGRRVMVVTIDPARRLADSLGLGDMSSTPVNVPLPSGGPGRLDALMLDATRSWDALVERLAPTPEVARRVMEHRYYRIARARLGGSHEYMAHDVVLQLWHGGRYDVVVVDTPPTSHASEFLRAPGRLGALLDEGLLRVLRMPSEAAGWPGLARVSEGLGQVLGLLAGHRTIEDISGFVGAFGQLSSRLLRRAQRAQRLLRGPATRALLVTTPTPAACDRALGFAEELREHGVAVGGLIINRTHPAPASATPPSLPQRGPLPAERWAAVCGAIEQAHARQRHAADEDQRVVDRVEQTAPSLTRFCVPLLPVAPCDLPSLSQLGPHLPQPEWLTVSPPTPPPPR